MASLSSPAPFSTRNSTSLMEPTPSSPLPMPLTKVTSKASVPRSPSASNPQEKHSSSSVFGITLGSKERREARNRKKEELPVYTRKAVEMAAAVVVKATGWPLDALPPMTIDLPGSVAVPPLVCAARLLLGIWDVVRLVKTNQHDSMWLTERCAGVLHKASLSSPASFSAGSAPLSASDNNNQEKHSSSSVFGIMLGSRERKEMRRRRKSEREEFLDELVYTHQEVERTVAAVAKSTGVTLDALSSTLIDLPGSAPVPPLVTAARLLLKIWDAVQLLKVPSDFSILIYSSSRMNRLSCIWLVDRCADALDSACDTTDTLGDEELASPMAKLIDMFTTIHTLVKTHRNCSFLERHFNGAETRAEFRACNDSITETVDLFGFYTHVFLLSVLEHQRRDAQAPLENTRPSAYSQMPPLPPILCAALTLLATGDTFDVARATADLRREITRRNIRLFRLVRDYNSRVDSAPEFPVPARSISN